jgi:hypothetical protein
LPIAIYEQGGQFGSAQHTLLAWQTHPHVTISTFPVAASTLEVLNTDIARGCPSGPDVKRNSLMGHGGGLSSVLAIMSETSVSLATISSLSRDTRTPSSSENRFDFEE